LYQNRLIGVGVVEVTVFQEMTITDNETRCEAPFSQYIYQIRSRFTLYYITLPFISHNIVEGGVPRNNNNQTSTAVTILFNPERFKYIFIHIKYYIVYMQNRTFRQYAP